MAIFTVYVPTLFDRCFKKTVEYMYTWRQTINCIQGIVKLIKSNDELRVGI